MPIKLGSAQAMGELLTCITPAWSESNGVTALTSSRLGGVSQAPYDSLNLGLHVADDKHSVDDNRRRFQAAWSLPSEPLWLNQVHGTDIEVIKGIDQKATFAAADGAWTDIPGRVIGVLTADCLPVVIADKTGTEVAVVHAGWRGLAAGVVGAALEKFSSGLPLHAWLGPAIGPAAFEVGEEVRQAFVDVSMHNAAAFTATQRKDKFLANLYQLATRELKEWGDIPVYGGEHCTMSEPRLFHSYRRDGSASGRMATVAWLADPES